MTVQGNDDGDGRRGLVTLGGLPFTIAQSGRGTSAPGPAAPSSCTPSVEPAALDVPSTAQSHSVDLEIGPGCNWTAVSNDSWVSLTSPRSGSGEARVQFAVSANTGTAARTGSLTVAETEVHDPAARCHAGAAVHLHRESSDTVGSGQRRRGHRRSGNPERLRVDCIRRCRDGLPLLRNPGRETPRCVTPFSRTARPLRERGPSGSAGAHTASRRRPRRRSVRSSLDPVVADRERGRRRGALPAW